MQTRMVEAQIPPWPVRLTEDGQTAELRLPSPEAAEQVIDVARCAAAFAEAGVVLDDALRGQIERALQGGRRRRIVLTAAPAVAGEDGRVAWADGLEPLELASPGGGGETADRVESDAVDYYARSRFVNVRRGQELARLVPPTEGRPGRDLRGEAIEARPGAEAEQAIDEQSVRLDGQGRCFARFDGVVRYEGRRISVADVLVIDQDVDFATGSVKVNCPVRISGNVCDRFQITTRADLSVRGVVEAAVIHTGGAFEAAGGVAGKFRARLDVGGDLKARYLNQVQGDVRGDATIEREMIHSTLNVGGTLQMDRAALINGRISVTGEAVVGQVGSESDEPTVIELGVDRRIEAAIEEATATLRQLQRQAKQGEQRRRTIEAGGTQRQREFAAELGRLDELAALIDKRRAQITDKRRRLQQRYDGQRRIELRIGRVIHRRTRLVSPACRAVLREPIRGPIRIAADEEGRLLVVDERTGSRAPLEKFATVTWTPGASGG